MTVSYVWTNYFQISGNSSFFTSNESITTPEDEFFQ